MSTHQTLTRHRPVAQDIAADWGQDRRAEVLSGLLDRAAVTEQSPRRAPSRSRRSRRLVLAGVAAASAAALVVVPGVVSRDAAPQASALQQLVHRAAAQPADPLPEGSYRHVVASGVQVGKDADTPAFTETRESWTAPNGDVWSRTRSSTDGAPARLTYALVTLGERPPGWDAPTAGYLASLPTDPHVLLDYIRSRADRLSTGPITNGQPVFESVKDLLAEGMTTPRLNAALIEVLGLLPGTTVTSTRFAGREAVRVGFREDGHVEAVFFDRTTSEVIGQSSGSPAYTRVVERQEVTTTLPDDVRRNAHEELSPDTPESVNGG